MNISIIVPVYQVEAYLAQCVESLLRQDFSDYEILLIDDGSTDQCGSICDEYARQDNRIRVFHQKNKGVSAARNLGMEVAAGEWLMFVDPDDWLEKNALRVLYQKAVETKSDIVCASFFRNYLDKQIPAWPENVGEKEYLIRENQQYLYERATRRTDPGKELCLRGPCWKLYRAAHLRAHQILFPVDLKISEDMIFNLHALYHAKKLYFIELPVYHYRMRKSSVCHADSSKILEYRIKSYAAMRAFMEKHHAVKELQPHFYLLIFTEFIDFSITRSKRIHNIGTFCEAAKEIKIFANHVDCRRAIKNVDVGALSPQKRVARYLLRLRMHQIFTAMCVMYCKIFFHKGSSTGNLYCP